MLDTPGGLIMFDILKPSMRVYLFSVETASFPDLSFNASKPEFMSIA